MDHVAILKALAGLVSALGAVAVYRFNRAQALKARAELVETFERALAAGQRHATAELFRLLHGLRMGFDDICWVCGHDQSNKIILALQKSPGTVDVAKREIKYVRFYKHRWVRRLSAWALRAGAYCFGLITAALIVVMAMIDGPASLALLVLIIPASAAFAMQIRDIQFDEMIRGLVEASNRQANYANPIE